MGKIGLTIILTIAIIAMVAETAFVTKHHRNTPISQPLR